MRGGGLRRTLHHLILTTVPVAEFETAHAPTLGIVKAYGERGEVEVEIADTRIEQARGLMARTELAEDAGMLFLLESEQKPGFCST